MYYLENLDLNSFCLMLKLYWIVPSSCKWWQIKSLSYLYSGKLAEPLLVYGQGR
jgi:hypothetical protein